MGDFRLVDLPNGWTVGRFASLDRLPGIVHFVTTRKALDVDLIASDRPAAAAALAQALGAREVAFLEQVHGETIIEAPGWHGPTSAEDRGDCGMSTVFRGRKTVPPRFAGRGDGLITDVPGLGLMCISADCPLILVADIEGRAVGVAHASWRATVKQIAFKIISRMAEKYKLDPSRLVACIAPSAGPDRYEVGSDVVEAAVAGIGPHARRFFREQGGKTFLDLWAANRDQLLAAGLRGKNIHVAGVCTITNNDLYPSYRVEGARPGRFAAFITKT